MKLKMPRLNLLWLSYTSITNECIKTIAKVVNLKQLNIIYLPKIKDSIFFPKDMTLVNSEFIFSISFKRGQSVYLPNLSKFKLEYKTIFAMGILHEWFQPPHLNMSLLTSSKVRNKIVMMCQSDVE